MSMIVSLSGGGIKGAVASARYAGEQDVVIVHIDYGQPSARAEIEAVEALASSLPRTKLMPVAVPHVLHLQGGGGADGDASKTTLGDSEAVLPPSVLRGLMPMLLSVGVQAAFRIGASTVVTSLITDLIDSRSDNVDDWLRWDGVEGSECDARCEMRTTLDDPTGAPTWTAWEPLDANVVTAWGLEYRLQVTSTDDDANIDISVLSVLVEERLAL